MGGAKFVVRGGRRWRDIDLSSGCVSGWGSAQFVSVRCGRLVLTPREPVLRGLRALAAGRPTTARDGPRLSLKRNNEGSSRKNLEDAPSKRTCHRCHPHPEHTTLCTTDANFNSILKPATSTVAVQCADLITTGTQVAWSPSLATPTYVTTKSNHSSQKSQALNGIYNRNTPINKNHVKEKTTRIKAREKRKRYTSSDESSEVVLQTHKLQRHVAQVHARIDDASRSSTDKAQSVTGILSKSLADRKNQKVPQSTKPRINAREKRKRFTSSDESSEVDLQTRKQKLQRRHAAPVHARTEDPSRSATDKSQSVSEILSKSLADRKNQKVPQSDPCVELIISEEDVMLLRSFIEKDDKNVFGVDLEKFDSDDRYKCNVFYNLNPLVNVERSRTIARMMREGRSQSQTSSQVSLADFITNLGLKRVADSAPNGKNKYKMRARRKRTLSISLNDSEREKEKENLTKSVTREGRVTRQRERVLEESVSEMVNRKNNSVSVGQLKESQGKASKPVDMCNGDDERLKGSTPIQSVGKVKGRANREYTAEEDQAIVRWVCGGGRARLVNGNRLWRELQDQHYAATGCSRSWHSLRNRYLRYLLPALSALTLPPHEAARLRAAAATGELKARNKPQRRNSVFYAPPTRSASGRRPRPPPTPTPAPAHNHSDLSLSPSPKRGLRSSAHTPPRHRVLTPTYSELTKRFALQHRSTPNDTSDSGTTGTEDSRPRRRSARLTTQAEAEATRRPRTRKLYNPRVV